ncbi:MAG: beta-lactamase family protein [Phycisphaeraceae bacterium]|nr:beta-lactamase family protein [Phycisphaerae bacterium]MBX3391533.1 beta-lactamase family protein [Phycisphaeraceae bacterium]
MKSSPRRHFPFAALLVVAVAILHHGAHAAASEPPPFSPTHGVQTDNPALAERLARLCEDLERKRLDQHIPSMALAVVKDGKVILMRGFGVRDLDGAEPADEHTIYAIGSQTKAFTSMLISLLDAQGSLSWDDKVKDRVDGFRLFDPVASEQATLRDACSHRTGLTRTDLLWASGKAAKREMLERLADAEPTAPFRSRWQYNNTMFMAAGMAAESVMGMTWRDLIAQRIFAPLGMADSGTTIHDVTGHPRAALGYRWNLDTSDHTRLPMREVTCEGAGAINSTAADMANWLIMLTSRGEFDGSRFIEHDRLERMWKKEIEVGGGKGYGLGWFVGEWSGRREIEHGGNIDGFFTACALLPDERTGFVLLGSLTYAALQAETLPMVWRAIFPPDTSDESPVPTQELRELVGDYRAGFVNGNCSVNIKDGKLHLDVPGQMNFELNWPDNESKWAFAMLPEQIKIRFNRLDDGRVASVTLFQGGAEIEMPRLGSDGNPVVSDAPAPMTLDQLRELTGAYHFAPADHDWKVVISDGKLAVDVPRQRVFPLRWPDDDGIWKLADFPAACRFNRDESGKAVSMTWFQSGAESDLPRVGDAEPSNLPTLQEINSLRRASADPEKIRAMGDIVFTGTVRAVNQGVQGTYHAMVNADGRYLQDLDFGIFGFIRTSYDGTAAWSHNFSENVTQITGERLEEIRAETARFLSNELEDVFDRIEIVERTASDDTPVIIVRGVTGTSARTVTMFLNEKDGLPVREETTMLVPGLGRLPITTNYSRYTEVSGVRFPATFRVTNEATGTFEIVIERVSPHAQAEPGAYTLREPVGTP